MVVQVKQMWDLKIKKALSGDRAGDHSRRPRLVIPCQVAPQQSLTPFHQMIAI
jgi:hypothetical protein